MHHWIYFFLKNLQAPQGELDLGMVFLVALEFGAGSNRGCGGFTIGVWAGGDVLVR